MAEPDDVLLIQFARWPVRGGVITRLVPALGEQGACDLHIALVRHTCRQLLAAALGPVEIWVSGNDQHPLFADCRVLGASQLGEPGGDVVGERMFRALQAGLQRFRRVLLVGSDCPALDSTYLRSAADALDHAPLVFGPALDGGYVLVGAREVDKGLFTDIAWGESSVLASTLQRANALGCAVATLEARPDIDRPEDLQHWQGVSPVSAG